PRGFSANIPSMGVGVHLKTIGIQVAARPRAAVFLDLENLLYEERDTGRLAEGLEAIEHMFDQLEQRTFVVARVAACDRSLAAAVALPLARVGIRTFIHSGGEDGADIALLGRM